MQEGVSRASSTPPDAFQMLQGCQRRYVCQCLDLHVAEAEDHCKPAACCFYQGRRSNGSRTAHTILVARCMAAVAGHADMLAPPARMHAPVC